jgi:hypothetical protein
MLAKYHTWAACQPFLAQSQRTHSEALLRTHGWHVQEQWSTSEADSQLKKVGNLTMQWNSWQNGHHCGCVIVLTAVQEPLRVSRGLNVSEAGSLPPEYLPGVENSGPDEAAELRVQQLREIIVALSGEKTALLGDVQSCKLRAETAETNLEAVTNECCRWSDEV